MTNVGDFDGHNTWGSRTAGGEGEYLVRVGTEKPAARDGGTSPCWAMKARVIAPMTTGGPDESALGDPVEALLTEWARQCAASGRAGGAAAFPQPEGRTRCQHRQRADATPWR